MKTVSKNTKIVTLLVIITLLFLLAFNVVYAYFTATANVTGNLNFGKLDVKFTYYLNNATGKNYTEALTSNLQVCPDSNLIRDSACGLTTSAGSTITDIGLVSSSDSCSAYVRFWLEVYKCVEINGTVYYIDSVGNYVDENGNYVDSTGASTTVTSTGEIVNYAEYFQLGMVYTDGKFYEPSDQVISQETTTVDGVNYVTYFFVNSFATNNAVQLGVSAIKMLSSAPSDLLGYSVVMYLSFDAVQSSNQAFKTAFDDNRGYCSDWK